MQIKLEIAGASISKLIHTSITVEEKNKLRFGMAIMAYTVIILISELLMAVVNT